MRFIPSPEFLAEFVEWRQSRMDILPSKCAFDRWYEALSKEHIWNQWMINGLVKSMDIPTRNTLAHLYVNARTPETEKRVGSARTGLFVLHNELGNYRSHFRYCNISFRLISIPLCSCTVGGRGVNSEAPEMSARCLQRHRRRGPGCGGGRSPRDRGIAG